MHKNFNNQQGFVALMSIILIAAILIVLVAVVSISSFYTRFNVLDYENKKVSVGLAESCATIAMVNLAKDATTFKNTVNASASGYPVTVGSNSCKICTIVGTGTGPYTVLSRGAYGINGKAYTNLQVIGSLTASNFNVASWNEITPNPAPSCTVP